MKHHLLFFLLIIGFADCQHTVVNPEFPATNKVQPQEKEGRISSNCKAEWSTDSLHIGERRGRFKVFREWAKAYCLPDTNSQVLDSFHYGSDIYTDAFITRLIIDSFIPDSNNPSFYQNYAKREDWLRFPRKQGPVYLRKGDMAVENYANYGFLVGSATADADTPVEMRTIDQKSFLIRHRFTPSDIMHGYTVKPLAFNGLSYSGQLIRYRTYRESCPGATLIEFVVLSGGRFTKLLSSFSTGEAGEYEEEIIYYPMEFENGKVLLVANADLDNIFNVQTGELNVYPFPEDLGIPINQLIVRTREYTEVLLDGNRNPIVAEDGDSYYQLKVVKEPPVFYKWEDGKLERVKSKE